ncbi:MAG: hypothetical protein J6U64_05735 [Alphaproteobacteria bacterium]|nr:hypothetical protein [Alphaproteobacteria bacterium]
MKNSDLNESEDFMSNSSGEETSLETSDVTERIVIGGVSVGGGIMDRLEISPYFKRHVIQKIMLKFFIIIILILWVVSIGLIKGIWAPLKEWLNGK